VFATHAGWIGVLGSDKGLRQVTLPQTTPQEVHQLLGSAGEAAQTPQLFQGLMERLKSYFDGHRVSFTDKLDPAGTTFQREVWEAARFIPYGETRSYRWVAERTGRPDAARAVGQALGRNPLPIIIPCHRVLASDGGIGGFTGGVETKKRLLRLESAASLD
jgi:methylated-DNA-[protein]-cysteine S-methyltransferase